MHLIAEKNQIIIEPLKNKMFSLDNPDKLILFYTDVNFKSAVDFFMENNDE